MLEKESETDESVISDLQANRLWSSERGSSNVPGEKEQSELKCPNCSELLL